MIITTLNYFERKDGTCQVPLGMIDNIDLFNQNPKFIVVDNDFFHPGEVFVGNNHESEYIRPEGDRDLVYVGIWKIKYK